MPAKPLLYDWLQRTIREQGGSGTAIVYRDTYLSWRGLAHRADRRAQELSAMGLGPGDWIGVMLGNVPELVILALAASKLGAVLVPLDPTTASRELDQILEVAPLRVLVTRPHGGDTPTPAPISPLRTDGRKGAARIQPEGRRRLQGTLLNLHLYRRRPAELPEAARADVVLFADMGGDPRGLVRSTATLSAIAETLVPAISLTGEDHVLAAAPLFHSFGFDYALLAPLRAGATLQLEDELSTKRLTKLLRDDRIDVFPGNPLLFGTLAREVAVKPIAADNPRFISSGSPLPAAVAEAFRSRYRVALRSAYHTTENGPLCLEWTGDHPTTVGKPLPGVELRHSDTAADAPTSEPRPLWVRAPGTAVAAIPELCLPARDGRVPIGACDPDGWFRTGDLGRFDAHGNLELSGREDDLVKIEGKRVALGEVAGCLEAFPRVREAEAELRHDDAGQPLLVARVVASGCRPEELIDHCARNLPPHKVPRQIELAQP